MIKICSWNYSFFPFETVHKIFASAKKKTQKAGSLELERVAHVTISTRIFCFLFFWVGADDKELKNTTATQNDDFKKTAAPFVKKRKTFKKRRTKLKGNKARDTGYVEIPSKLMFLIIFFFMKSLSN